jgi:Uma2 family endonuclease
MATVRVPAVQRLVLQGVDWDTYRRLLRALDERPSLRLTYDRGTLEIMTLTFGHESWGHLLGRLVVALTEELGLPIAGGGSTTFRRKRQRRGLEPDESYWIANEPLVRGKQRIDLRVDPPPDLAIEIDVTRSSLDRLGIYAALGVPEVWRYDGQNLTFHLLGANSQYTTQGASRSFPLVTPADVVGFLAQRGQTDENSVVRQFRTWVRQRLPGGPPSAPPVP